MGEDREVRVYTKGGPDFMMKEGDITKMLDPSGVPQPITEEAEIPESLENVELAENDFDDGDYATLIKKITKSFAHEAYRTILVCYRDMSMAEYEAIVAEEGNLETDLTAIGIYGIQDPLRDGIYESIDKCKTAGIRVIMCTGDNLDTAIAISRNAGIVNPEEVGPQSCMTGLEFR
jgi:magnesium-transporting ATPase (P-type)